MAQRLSENQKDELKKLFISGFAIEELAEKFECTKLTISRNLKKKIGEYEYKILKEKNNVNIKKEENENNKNALEEVTHKKIKLDIQEKDKNKYFEDELNNNEAFIEIAPLNFKNNFLTQKELTSRTLDEISLPKIVFMIVDKKIDLDIKLLNEYPEWQFLPEDDLNRKTIRIFYDIKTARGLCNKDNKVIKVPNTDVFKLTSHILVSKGITRIVGEDQLISL